MLKKIILSIVSIMILLAIVLLPGCIRKEQYGLAIDPAFALEKVSNILSRPESYLGKQVVLKGKIDMECGSGCWFYVDDGTGRIYVDLNPGGIAIPQRVGKAVTVIGKVAKEEDMLMVNATGVAF
jgi:starvation-inducible outer membrane lipoprotein